MGEVHCPQPGLHELRSAHDANDPGDEVDPPRQLATRTGSRSRISDPQSSAQVPELPGDLVVHSIPRCNGSPALVEYLAEPAGERLGLPRISGVFGGEAAMVTREHDRLRALLCGLMCGFSLRFLALSCLGLGFLHLSVFLWGSLPLFASFRSSVVVAFGHRLASTRRFRSLGAGTRHHGVRPRGHRSRAVPPVRSELRALMVRQPQGILVLAVVIPWAVALLIHRTAASSFLIDARCSSRSKVHVTT